VRAALEHQAGTSPAALGEKLAERLFEQGARNLLEIMLPTD
jgi:hypothetical protein